MRNNCGLRKHSALHRCHIKDIELLYIASATKVTKIDKGLAYVNVCHLQWETLLQKYYFFENWKYHIPDFQMHAFVVMARVYL